VERLRTNSVTGRTDGSAVKSGAALLFLAAAVAILGLACGGDDSMQAPYASDEIVEVPQADAAAANPANRCAQHAEGCPCMLEDGEAECGLVTRVSDGYVSCSKGKRLCRYGKWGPCEGDKIAPHVK
jgi:hypothetical protein